MLRSASDLPDNFNEPPAHIRAHLKTKKGEEISALMRAVAEVLPLFVAKATAPLVARIAELESRPSPKWCGPFRDGDVYPALSFTVCNGSLWVSKRATTDRPGSNPEAWQLCCKQGQAR